jgi:hypothetical protein
LIILKNLLISVFDFFFAFLVFFTFTGLLLDGVFKGLLLLLDGVFKGVLLLLDGVFKGVFFALGDRFTVSLCFLAL